MERPRAVAHVSAIVFSFIQSRGRVVSLSGVMRRSIGKMDCCLLLPVSALVLVLLPDDPGVEPRVDPGVEPLRYFLNCLDKR